MTLSETHFDPLDVPPPVLAGVAAEDGPAAPFPCPTPDGSYAAQALALLPPGPAWPRHKDSVMARLVSAAAQPFQQVHERFCALLFEATPITTGELLADWERVLGLPDDCAPPPATVVERRARLLQRLAAMGGQSRAYYTEVARALGFDILIEEFRPFQIGASRAGDPLDGVAWRFAWRAVAPETTQRFFHAGENSSGEPLSAFGNEILSCVLDRIKPAHTVLHIAYAPLIDGLSPLLWVDIAQSMAAVANGVVTRIDSLHGAPSDLTPQPDALLMLAPQGPDQRTVLALPSETGLAYAFDPPLPTLAAGFALVALVQGGPQDAAAALGPAYQRLGLVLGPREATLGEGAARVTLADPAADPQAWRLVTLLVAVENGMRRVTLRRDGVVIAETLAPFGAIDTMAVLAERVAVLGLLGIPPEPERAAFIERRVARGWNIPLSGE